MILQDNFGRHFHYLRLSITDLCNFRCNYCLPDGNECSSKNTPLTLDEIETLVSAFARLGTSKIRITGGEPAIRKDLSDIISICKKTPGIRQVALTTNGFNLNRQIDKFVEAGLNAINISADSLDPRMFAAITGKDKLDNILEGIDTALAAGLTQVKLNTVLLRQYNYRDLGQFFEFIKSHPVTWRFIELMRTGDNGDFFNQNHVSGKSLEQQLQSSGWQSVIRDKSAGPAAEYNHPDYLGRIGLIMPYSKDFCQSCNRLRVSSQGKLHLCLFADQGFDIRPYLQSRDVKGTCEAILQLMHIKPSAHALDRGLTGSTRQLAMLGG